MDRYADGDDAVFARLYALLAPRVLTLLRRIVGRSRADDLTQETFLRVHRSRGTFQPGSSATRWVYAIARNTMRDEHRRNKQFDIADVGVDEPAASSVQAGVTGEEYAVAAETTRLVARVLAALPLSQREAFVLMRFEGMTVKEAAEVLDTTPTAVKLRAFRAYEAIRAALATQEGK